MKNFAFMTALALCVAGCTTQNKNNTAMETNSVIENIMTRTSIRQFTAQPVSDEQVETLLRCGLAAPTAVNAQPWEFVVVRDRAILDTLGQRYPNTRISENVSVAIVPCGNLEKTFKPAPDFWIQDVSAATENILLAAHAMGLGAVWTGVYPTDKVAPVQALLNLPEHIVPLCIIPVGYPAEDPAPKDKYKPEIIHYDRW